ncbi:MAG: hypothetical protein KY475_14915 [Planctomycetes bacterium]|nr:hypothetical protein [Planctomycetota bacterium]
MSIGKRVSDTIEKMKQGDAESALFQICAAIDTTAKAEFAQPKARKKDYKDFIHRSLGLITEIGFGPRILNINLGYAHPEIKANADGCVSIQDVIYHAIRCGFYHDSSLPSNLHFEDEAAIRVSKEGDLFLPSTLVWGLMWAVVVAPVNSGERAAHEVFLTHLGAPLPLSKLWGRRAELLWLFEATREAARLHGEAQRMLAATTP